MSEHFQAGHVSRPRHTVFPTVPLPQPTTDSTRTFTTQTSTFTPMSFSEASSILPGSQPNIQDQTRFFQAACCHQVAMAISWVAFASVVPHANKVFGISHETLQYCSAYKLIFMGLATLLTVPLLKYVNHRLVMFGAIGIEAIAALLVLACPIVFNLFGSTAVVAAIGFGVYLSSIGLGLNLGATVPFVAGWFAAGERYKIFALYLMAPITSLVLTFFMRVTYSWEFGFLVILLIVYAVNALCVYRLSANFAVNSQTQVTAVSLKNSFPPFFVLLIVLASLTQAVLGYYAETGERIVVREIIGDEGVGSLFLISSIIVILWRISVRSLAKYVTEMELLFAGAIGSTIGLFSLSNATQAALLYKADLFIHTGIALAEPAMLALVACRYNNNNNNLSTNQLQIFFGLVSLAEAILITWGHPFASSELPQAQSTIRWLACVPLVLATVYGVIIYQSKEGLGFKLLSQMHWPKDQTLSTVLGWGMFGCLSASTVAPPAQDLQTVIGQAFLSFFYGYAFGPFWSSFVWVWLISVALFLYIAAVILFQMRGHVDLAKSSFKALFGIAMFTIWLEPWLTINGILFNVGTGLLNTPIFFVVDVTASLGWWWALAKVLRSLDKL